MKKGKLLILLAAILSFALLFVSCAPAATDTDTSSESATTPTASETESEKADDEAIADAAEQDTEKHEIHNYFDLVSEEDDVLLSQVSRLEGELVGADSAHNLVILRDKNLDSMNQIIDTWTVYDLAADKAIFTDKVIYPYMAEPFEKTGLTVSLNYPVIQTVRTTCYETEEGVYDYSYDVSYYLANAEEYKEAIHTTDTRDFDIHKYDNGLVCVELGDKMFWIDKNLEIVRSADAIFANGYDVDAFDSEYKGYLYSYNEKELLIFNRSGIVSGRYVAGNDSMINSFVLNNGNVLIQELTVVGIYDSCDFVLEGTRIAVKSFIMNFISGECEEIDLDFVVSSIVTKYYQDKNDESNLVLVGADNYGYVYDFANGYIAKGASLCVFDDSMNKLFALENDTYGIDIDEDVYAIRDDLYTTTVKTEGAYYTAIFTLDGELVSYVNGEVSLTDKYIVSNTAIYDYNMNKVFDVIGNGYTFGDVIGNDIYLTKNNFTTGAEEVYVIHSDSKAPELFADGVSFKVDTVSDAGYYVLYDIERDVYVAYNLNGEELIVSHNEFYGIGECEDACVFATVFNGELVMYVVK